MVIIAFPDKETENRGLGFLMIRFSGRILRGGIHIVSEAAVEGLAAEGIPFTMKGKASYEQQVAPVRTAPAPPLQRRRRHPARVVRSSR